MSGSYAASLFYCLAWAALAVSFFMYRKTETKAYAITWLVITILLTTCYQTFCAAILNTVHLPVNIVSIGLTDLIPAAWFVYRTWKTGRIQKYCLEKADIIFVILLAVLMLYLLFGHFAGKDLWLSYLTIDPAAHLKAAVDVIRNQSVNNMFYSALFNGLFMEIFLPVIRLDFMYKVFVLSDIVNYGLAGMMFYGLIRRYMKNPFGKAAGVIISLLYVTAYPLNNTLYGFVYLGMGVTLTLLLLELTRAFVADELGCVFSVVLLTLGCLSLFESYVLFVPVVYLAIITAVFLKRFRQKKLVSTGTVFLCLGIFLLPCIIGVYYTYFGVFSDGVTVENQIAAEGAIYRSLYVNFLPFLPFAFYETYSVLREKRNSVTIFLFFYTIIFMVLLLAGGMTGRVSSYYYYKIPYLFWAPLLFLAFLGVLRVADKAKGVVVSGFAVYLCVFLAFFTGVEYKIEERNGLFDTNAALSSNLNDIYSYNKTYFRSGSYPYYKMVMYHWVYENLLLEGEDMVAIASGYQDDIWFQAITNQRLNGWNFVSEDHTAYYEKLRESSASYVVVMTDDDSLIYHDNQEFWDSLEKIYENEQGFVVKLDVDALTW